MNKNIKGKFIKIKLLSNIQYRKFLIGAVQVNSTFYINCSLLCCAYWYSFCEKEKPWNESYILLLKNWKQLYFCKK